MDRTSLIGIFACLALLLGLEFYINKYYPTPPYKPHAAANASISTTNPALVAPTPAPVPASTPSVPTVPEVTTILENPAIKVTLTSKGAAIKEVELKQHVADDGHVVLNQKSHSGVLELAGWPGADTAVFAVKSSSPEQAAYTTQLPGGVTWERTYTFGPDLAEQSGFSGSVRLYLGKLAHMMGQPEPVPLIYSLNVTDTLTNPGTTDATLPAYSLSVGRAEPLFVQGQYQPGPYRYPGSGWFTQKSKSSVMTSSALVCSSSSALQV